MLWYKVWLETRLRAVLMLAVMAFILWQIYSHGGRLNGAALLGGLQFMWVITPISMAGSGIRPESPFRAVKGIQGSMYYTLSLPVSRFRLFATRAWYGLLETAAVIGLTCLLAAMVLPPVRAQFTGTEGAQYAAAIFVCGWAAFGVSTLLATVLDQQWQGFASMFIVFFAKWLISTEAPASPLDFFRVMGASPTVLAHAIPWAAMGTSCAVALACMAAAVMVERTRQY